jgi:uncharacterized protein (DUF1778 family)
MSTKTLKSEKTRFDARLTREQKQFFEKAAAIGGYRSLSDFVISTVEERAQEIIRQSESFIQSESDSEIFFEAIFNPGPPNEALLAALQEYNKMLAR